MRKLILKNGLSPGDVVTLTAAVRDLHRAYPEQFLTDVRTPCPALWENNPYLTALADTDPEAEQVECHYPLIGQSNQTPYHFIHGFIEFLNQKLGLQIRPTAFRGDIHLSATERHWMSQVHEITRSEMPFWIVVAGGKYDFTAKWWAPERYQRVVDHFRERILFVQVGEASHYHPTLNGVLDLRGKTDLRQLVRLVYHSQGVLCPVTFLMHLAPAVEVKGGRPVNRPCVVIAGGREPSHWEAYTNHQFVHTNGALPCCEQGGCWRSRVLPIWDGDEKDQEDRRCVDVVRGLPRCLDIITAEEVIRRITLYFEGGTIRYLSSEEAEAAKQGLESWSAKLAAEDGKARVALNIRFDETLTAENALPIAERLIQIIPAYPGGFAGRGIVLAAGGFRYFAGCWVCIKMLRRLGCSLPVQVWHLGTKEMDESMKALVSALGVECVDAFEVRKAHPARILNGWELKPYAILHSRFKEVLFLDADNVPVLNPGYLFDAPQFKETGAVFWPDYGRLAPDRRIWEICGVEYRDEPEFESGQILVDKERCWKALRLCMWYNEHSDLFYHHVHGDKETFHMAFRKLGQPYSMPATPIEPLDATMCQHDFGGRRVFQHRNCDKWDLFARNKRIAGFLYEAECFDYLSELRQVWDGRIGVPRFDAAVAAPGIRRVAKELVGARFDYRRVGHDQRPMGFLDHGLIGEGSAGCEVYWNLESKNGKVVLQIFSEDLLTCELSAGEDGIWRGRWTRFEQMPVELVPLREERLNVGAAELTT